MLFHIHRHLKTLKNIMTSTIQEYLSFLYFSLRFQFKQGQTYNCCRTDEYFCAIQDTVVSPFTPHIIPVDSVSSDHMIKTAFVTKAGIMFIFIIDCFLFFFCGECIISSVCRSEVVVVLKFVFVAVFVEGVLPLLVVALVAALWQTLKRGKQGCLTVQLVVEQLN